MELEGNHPFHICFSFKLEQLVVIVAFLVD